MEALYKAQRADGKGWIFGLPTYLTEYAKDFNEIDGIQCNKTRDNYDVISLTICQWIGETDRNGNKIFENDFDQNHEVIKWCRDRLGYSLFMYNFPTKSLIACNCYACEGNYELSESLKEIEIKGNIFDS